MSVSRRSLPVVGFAESYAQGEDVLLKMRGESHRGNL